MSSSTQGRNQRVPCDLIVRVPCPQLRMPSPVPISEAEAQRELHPAWEVQLLHGQYSEIRSGWVGRGRVLAQRRIGGIERLAAEPQLGALAEPEALAERQVQLRRGMTADLVEPGRQLGQLEGTKLLVATAPVIEPACLRACARQRVAAYARPPRPGRQRHTRLIH